MLIVLKIGVLVSLFISIFSLTALVMRTFSFGRNPLYSEPRGSRMRGVTYAFGKGMMPWEKESARKHYAVTVIGMLFHTAIFLALFYLLSLIFSVKISGVLISLFRILFVLGAAGGLTLFFRRISLPSLKKISCPDDFAANVIVNLFLVSALLRTFFEGLSTLFFVMAIVVFLYIPLGKIRHCFFFFYVKVLFGLFYGRRGVLPLKIHRI